MASGAFTGTMDVAALMTVLPYTLVASIVGEPDSIAISGMLITDIVAVLHVPRISRTTRPEAGALPGT
ncbi:hypothetical protein ACWEO1_20830 [Kitasatospora cineracea]